MRTLWLTLLLAAAAFGQQGPRVRIETSKGAFTMELFPDKAPQTVENFLRYVDLRYYDDTIFHRVIPKFVVQGGGFTPELNQKPTLPAVPIETKNGLTNDRGTVAMARDGRKDSATSQFFINLGDNETLNRSAHGYGYTVFGKVIEGMETVDAIANVQTSTRGPMKDVPILPVFLDKAYRVKEPKE
ncbi:MAG: peptidyl-prolyl cis-trans isomerase [Acidobacteria bacterium]|nr:peptidyl-prolyl cis-trans isomerase [Acidobacteriota bacterium]